MPSALHNIALLAQAAGLRVSIELFKQLNDLLDQFVLCRRINGLTARQDARIGLRFLDNSLDLRV
jgi:hypothetical protein